MFNLEKYSGLKKLRAYPRSRKKIRDRGINWEEHYKERSERLKERFEDEISKGVYKRWEGHDYLTNGDYFVVVSPSLTKDGIPSFFAGIKRLPENPKQTVYAPSGKYFSSLHSAFSHVSQKWGVPFPQDVTDVQDTDLVGIKIPRTVKAHMGDNMKIIKVAQSYVSIPINVKRTINNEIASMGNYSSSIVDFIKRINNVLSNHGYSIPHYAESSFYARFNIQSDPFPYSEQAECGTPQASRQRDTLEIVNSSGEETASLLAISFCLINKDPATKKYEIIAYLT